MTEAVRHFKRTERGLVPLTPVAKVWLQLAHMTEGIVEGDPRFQPVMDALDQCERAGLDVARLRQAAAKVKAAVLA